VSPPATSAPPGGWWRPVRGLTWDVQLTAAEPAAVTAAVLELDGADTSANTVAALRARGVRTICYVNAGGWEDWRPDASAFPAAVLGAALDDWPGERWLDLRRRDVLVPLMERRIQACADKGFDAVDPDNLDGWQAASGFALIRADAVAYEAALVEAAHRRGLSAGLKNALGLLPELGGVIDFAVNEQCVEYRECDRYAGVLAAGKPVFHIEYADATAACAGAPAGLSTVVKRLSLDSWSQRC